MFFGYDAVVGYKYNWKYNYFVLYGGSQSESRAGIRDRRNSSMSKRGGNYRGNTKRDAGRNTPRDTGRDTAGKRRQRYSRRHR